MEQRKVISGGSTPQARPVHQLESSDMTRILNM